MRRSIALMSSLNIGQILQGKNASYTIISLLRNRPDNPGPWLATGPGQERFTVKTAPPHRLKLEIEMLQLMQGHDSIRQMVDQVKDPASMILEYMDDNVFGQMIQKQHLLPKLEVKRALKATFQALSVIHDQDIVHTDVKPDNIFVKNSTEGARYKLGDLGDSAYSNVPTNNGGHRIGPAILSAPEVHLGIPWTTKADIWAAGATGITLVTGYYAFRGKAAPPPLDPQLPNHVLEMQNEKLGPISREAFKGLANDSILPRLQQLEESYRPYPLSKVPNISLEDVEFFCYVMKIDPRQRPTAKQLLQHSWFREA